MEKLARGRRDGKGGLSPRSVRHLYTVLSTALRQAVKWQLIPRNPCEAVEPPRVERQERPVADRDRMARMLAESRDTWLYMPILLAACCGLRRGEALALRWEDMDLPAGTLAVRRSASYTREGGLQFKAPKSSKSRVVSLPTYVVQELRRHRGRQAETKLLAGPGWQDHGLVVTREDGAPRMPDNLTGAFGNLLARHDLPPIHFHDLRHSCATTLLLEGVHVKVVSEMLGHAGIAITMDLYSHVLPSMQEDAARKMDAAIRRAVGDAG